MQKLTSGTDVAQHTDLTREEMHVVESAGDQDLGTSKNSQQELLVRHNDSRHRNRYEHGHVAESGGQDELSDDEDTE